MGEYHFLDVTTPDGINYRWQPATFLGMRVIVDPKMPANSFGLITDREAVVCIDGVIRGPFYILPPAPRP